MSWVARGWGATRTDRDSLGHGHRASGGMGAVWWMTERLFAETMPDFALEVILQPATLEPD